MFHYEYAKVCYILTLFFHKEKTGTSLVTEKDPWFFTGYSVDYSSVRIKHFIHKDQGVIISCVILAARKCFYKGIMNWQLFENK
jgi:hypothetical protein